MDKPLKFNNISDLMRRLKLDPPAHPMITLVNYDQVKIDLRDAGSLFMLDFYKISFKKSFNGSVKYGPGTYDFKEGGLAFLTPGQVVQMSPDSGDYQGYVLYFHPALLAGHSLAQNIHQYGFFDYAVDVSGVFSS
ncbi:hypothetical protein GCM10023149_30180 [Mucilaginibacter gynuensis]|uniref:AraC-type arabinose-binding/dimerisation domain-containing protein n=1 Tax=Mucilaginibacter gynuensis TaxID=1302236 RepID=A0ABP8GMD5_9SPHI